MKPDHARSGRKASALSTGAAIAIVIIIIAGIAIYLGTGRSNNVSGSITAPTTPYSVSKSSYSYNPFNQVATTTEYSSTCSFTISGVAVGNGSALSSTTVGTTTNCSSSAIGSSSTMSTSTSSASSASSSTSSSTSSSSTSTSTSSSR